MTDSNHASETEEPDQPSPGTLSEHDLDGLRVWVIDVPAVEVPTALSTAEQEVVQLVLEGMSNREIARHRGTSVRTAANQLASIYRKLNVSSRAELATMLAESGI